MQHRSRTNPARHRRPAGEIAREEARAVSVRRVLICGRSNPAVPARKGSSGNPSAHADARCRRDARTVARFLLLLFLVILATGSAPAGPGPSTTETVSLARVMPGAEIRTREAQNLLVEYAAPDEAWVNGILTRADAARRVVNRATGDALLVRIHILFAPTQQLFVNLSGRWAENSVAVAIPGTRQVIINGDGIRRGSTGTLGTTLVHELAHIYVGVRCLRPLPRWLDEGIAMNIAAEWSVEDSAALVLSNSVGGLIPLREIQSGFPVAADPQRLAYRQSYSVVRHIMRTRHGDSMEAFLRTITGPGGVAAIERFWDSLPRETLEVNWRQSLTLRRNWPLLTFDSGLLWGGMALLLVAAWVAVRLRRRRQHAEWDEEERVYAVLDEEEERAWGRQDPDELVADEDDEPWNEDRGKRPPWYGG